MQFRILGKEDVTERYLGWLNDPDVNRFLETRFAHQTLDACRQFVSDMERDPCSHLFGIFDKKTLEHLGNTKLGFINTNHRNGQLSLLIGEKSHWEKGYAAESVRSITKWAFDVLALERISAGCYDTNTRSLRAFLKVGYSVEGFFRNSIVSDGRRIGSFSLGILKNDRVS
ncbi:GNAT family N-acetyltransferase [Glaciimonas sp. GNP009]